MEVAVNGEAAAGVNGLAGDVGGVIRGEERDDASFRCDGPLMI